MARNSERTRSPGCPGGTDPSFQNFRRNSSRWPRTPRRASVAAPFAHPHPAGRGRADLANPSETQSGAGPASGPWPKSRSKGLGRGGKRLRTVSSTADSGRRKIIRRGRVFSQRLGAGEPYYTTGPAPIFFHSRSADLLPPLTLGISTRPGGRQGWMPARIISTDGQPDHVPAGAPNAAEKIRPIWLKTFPTARLCCPARWSSSIRAFEDHFMADAQGTPDPAPPPLLTGMKRLGRAVEETARWCCSARRRIGRPPEGRPEEWYRERSRGEGLPLSPGGLPISSADSPAPIRPAPQYPANMTPSLSRPWT